MNASLYRSWHAAAAFALAAGFAYWAHAVGAPLGFAAGGNRTFLLWSGVVALALFVVLWTYAARKAAHRTRWSAEFARALPIEQIERAQLRLADLRVDALAGRATEVAPLRARATRALVEEGVGDVVTAEVLPATDGAPARIVLRWREPLGRLAAWLHAHLYYGLAAAVLVTLHGGLRFVSPMGILLNALSIGVIGTGAFGIALWTFGPAWLSRAERDLNYERAAALRDHYARKADASARSLAESAGGGDAVPAVRVQAALRGDPTAERDLLLWAEQHEGPWRSAVRDFVTLLGQQRGVAAAWRRTSSRRQVLHAWRLVHVPLSIVLLLAVAVHVVSVWIY